MIKRGSCFIIVTYLTRSWVCFVKRTFHCPIVTESEGTQFVGKANEICSACFCPIVSITRPNCWTKFLSDSEKLPPIVWPSLTCQTTADHLWLLFSPNSSSLTGPILHLIFHPILWYVRQWDASLNLWIYLPVIIFVRCCKNIFTRHFFADRFD